MLDTPLPTDDNVWCEHDGYYLSTYCSVPCNFRNFARAQAMCIERNGLGAGLTCGGITRVNNEGYYSLRKSSDLRESSTDVSWKLTLKAGWTW